MKRGIKIVEVDRNVLLEEQGPFHVIVHKYGRDENWEQALEEYIELHPETVIIDPIGNIQRLRNRATMLSLLQCDGGCVWLGQNGHTKFELKDVRVKVPKQIEVALDLDLQEVEVELEREGLRFPLVIKPKWTDGGEGSHMLALVKDKEGLKEALNKQSNPIKPPFVAQQFIEHDCILFKVYVIGNQVISCSRPSLDVKRCLSSFQLLPRISSRKHGMQADQESADLPPENVTQDIALILQKELQLQLFNFDLIKEQGSEGVYFIVDINYFPGIDKLSNFEHLFVDFLFDLCQQSSIKLSDLHT